MISDCDIQAILQKALDCGADFAELFFEDREDVSIDYDGAVNGVASMSICGAGLYLIAGRRSVYVCTNEQTAPSLAAAVHRAAELLRLEGGGGRTAPPLRQISVPEPCPVRVYPGTVGYADKIAVLREADAAARAVTGALRRVKLTYFDRDQRVRIVNSEGADAEDRRVTTRLRFIPFLENEYGAASHFADYSAAAGFEALAGGSYIPHMTRVIGDMESSLRADEAPGGRFPVILEGGSCTGTFFHEACGHQLETTELRMGGLFWDRRGQRVASPKVTLVDDGTMPGMYGSSRFDDEGMPRRRNVLIDKGVLRGFLTDRMGALLLDLPRSGSGRRQDYAHAPGARMSNTYLAAGDDDDDDIIRDTEEGLYVTGMGGGTGGREFTLMANVAYWIKNGRIDRQVKGAMLLGRGDETMLKIDRVGKTLIAEQGGGSFCGASSGFCPTTTSGPRMRVSDMLVGGKGGRP